MAMRDHYFRREDDEPPFAGRRAAAPVASSGLLSILWRRKLTILACILAALAVGIGYIVVTPPRYLATSTILIDPRLGKTVGTDPVTPGFITDTSAMDSQIKLFTSQTVLARAAKMANLADNPEFNGSQRSLIDRILHPQVTAEGGVDLKALENAITVKRPERTYLIQIDVLARDPKKAAAIANDVVQAYIDDQVSSRVDSAHDDSQYVRQKLDKLSAELRDADEKIAAYKVANGIIDTGGLRSNEQQVADLTRSLSEARAKTSDAQSRLSEIEQLARSGHLDSTSPALNSMTIERLRQQQSEAEQTVAKLAMTLGPRHPELMEAKGRAAKTAKLIRDELERLKTGARANVDSDKATEHALATQVDALKGQSTSLGQKLVPLEQLQRNASILRSSFNRFSQVNDNLAQQGADSPPGRVVSVARPPVSPARPKKSLTLLIALSAGLFLGIAAAMFGEGTAPPEPYPVISPVMPYEAPPRSAPPAEPPPARARASRRYWDDDDDVRA